MLRTKRPTVSIYAFILLSLLTLERGRADEFFDPPYHHPRKTFVEINRFRAFDVRSEGLPERSNTVATIRAQSPVRNQMRRGSCSIFSALAFVEYFALGQGVRDPDYSEQYLQYLTSIRFAGGSGSTTNANFSELSTNGVALESELAYRGETWSSVEDNDTSRLMCGRLEPQSTRLKMCLTGHRDPLLIQQTDQQLLQEGGPFYDPEFQAARASARRFRSGLGTRIGEANYTWSESKIKQLLNQGIPVFLDIDVFYGAWNHSKASSLESSSGLAIGRDMAAWNLGEVGYPEQDSLDAELSPREPAGHSVLLVGYDDTVVTHTEVRMSDGSVRPFSYRGVYYFKNSWGTGSFGAGFSLEGNSFPGYGSITQKYAHEKGVFFEISTR